MRRKDSDSVRITSAPRSHSEDVRGRTRRYLVSMGIRTLCFVASVLSIGHWFMWVFLFGAIFLPYVAVVIANAGGSPDPGDSDHRYDPERPALGDRPADTLADRPAEDLGVDPQEHGTTYPRSTEW